MQATILFSGPGGTSQGLKATGFSTIGIENSEDAVSTAYMAGHDTVFADVRDLNPKDYGCDLLQASPPCQIYSVSGLKAGRHMEDFRKELVYEPMRWIRTLTPQHVILEQVPWVLDIWNVMAEELRPLDYNVITKVLDAQNYGVPQARKRAILIASKDSVTLPTTTQGVSMAEACGWNPEDLVGFPRKADWRGASVEINGTLYRARDLRAASRVSATLTSKARSWTRFSGDERYRVNIEEAGQLQTFPLDYPWQGSRTSQFLQCANAFSPKMVESLSASLI